MNAGERLERTIEIDGRTVSVERFVRMLDDARYDRLLVGSDGRIFSDFCTAIVPLQEMAERLVLEDDETVSKDDVARIEEAGLSKPRSTSIPEALSELFVQLRFRFGSFLLNRLSEAEKRTTLDRMDVAEAKRMESERRRVVERMVFEIRSRIGFCDEFGDSPNANPSILASLMRMKRNGDFGYSVSKGALERESNATELLVGILARSTSSKFLSKWQAKSLVELGIVGADEFSEILKESGDERDWESFEEDLTGLFETESIGIEIETAMKIARPRFDEILGL